jgi:TPR repeat protein
MQSLTVGAVLALAAPGLGFAQRNLAVAPAQATEQRVALVIGNSSYKNSPLKNPLNDATDVALSLRDLGFEVVLRIDADRRQMVEAVREFGGKLKKGGVGLFYFAGHGMQSRGRNFLIPVGAALDAEADLEFETLDANMVLAQMDEAGNRVNIVVLDACRNNPFVRSFRSSSRGLAQMDAATGTFLAYATAPGSIAADGDGRNGIFTKHLLASLKDPDSRLEDVFKRVRVQVARETGNKQIPWDSSSLTGDFFFRTPPKEHGQTASATTGMVGADAAIEVAFWQSIKEGSGHEEHLVYLDRYPNGQFAALAKSRVDRIHEDLAMLVISQWKGFRLFDYESTSSGMPMLSSPVGPSLREKATSAQLNQLSAIYRHEADSGDPRAQVSLGVMYLEGLGVGKDETRAISWFHRAADQGAASGQIALAEAYVQGSGVMKDDVEAVKWYRKAAEQGNAHAQRVLGDMYAQGIGVAKDDVEAVKWYRKSAEQGNVVVQGDLGDRYATGRGVAKDDVEAVKWYRKSAEQGYPLGQTILGYRYAQGIGVARDDREAVKWLQKAAEQNNPEAQQYLGVMHLNGRGVAKDDREAVRWFRKAAEQENARGQSYLGVMYANGRGVRKDDVEAVKWYRKAAEQGDASGQSYLGVMFANGRGVAKDDSEAVKWYRKAADQDDAQGQAGLGYMYESGRGVARDNGEAAMWFRKAAEQGFSPAQANLGVMYFEGRGVPTDRQEAIRWWRMAAANGNADAQENLRILGEK